MILQEIIFSKEECEEIINYSLLEGNEPIFNFTNNPTGNYKNNRVTYGKDTSYNVYRIKNTPQTEWMFTKLINWFSIKSNVELNMDIKHEFCTLHKYNIGDKFSKHIDLSKGFENRRYNLGIQLNDDYEGGEYVCWNDKNEEIILSKKQGTALVYHCRVPHEIKEITNGSRWSIVMTIHNSEIIEKQNLL